MFKAKPVSRGVGIGPAAHWNQRRAETALRPVAPDHTEAEVERFEAAVASARAELEALRDEAAQRLGGETAAIMEAHLLMLDDPALVGQVIERIRSERMEAPGLLQQVGEAMAQLLAGLDDPYLRERAADVRDVTGRLLRHLTDSGGLELIPAGAVLIAADLPPSELLRLPSGHLAAIALMGGGETSHTAILTKSLGIPAVMGLGEALAEILPGTTVLVDGEEGLVAVDPSAEILAQYQRKAEALERERLELQALVGLPAVTQDGHRVQLGANIGSAKAARVARDAGAEGVGLFRTEFLFLDRADPPGEQEQYETYKAALEAMAPYPVLIRTLDIGGDKPLAFLGIEPEANPFLGYRGIRLCQGFADLFRTQLRAILRASAHGRLRLMVPMVSTISEIRWVREQLEQVRLELSLGGDQAELGIMVETPAAAVLADQLAPLVDFFSIGTNDLTQYTMAVDRGNPKVAGLYDPLHPAVLRLVRMVVEGAHRAGKWVGMCGELAGDPIATALLIGLGLDELSMSTPQLAHVKRAVRATSLERAKRLAEEALSQADGGQVRQLLS